MKDWEWMGTSVAIAPVVVETKPFKAPFAFDRKFLEAFSQPEISFTFRCGSVFPIEKHNPQSNRALLRCIGVCTS